MWCRPVNGDTVCVFVFVCACLCVTERERGNDHLVSLLSTNAIWSELPAVTITLNLLSKKSFCN